LRVNNTRSRKLQEASTVTGSLPSNCKGTVCTVRVVDDSTKLRQDRRLEPYTFGRVGIEEYDEKSRLAQASAVKKGRWKLKALHMKVGGCKQF